MEPMLEIHVKNVLMVDEQGIVRDCGVVVVHLQRHRGTFRAVIPPAQNVSSAVVSFVGKGARIRGAQRRNRQRLAVLALVNVTLQGQGIGSGRRPIRAKSAAQRVPSVMRRYTRRVLRWSPVEIFSVHSVSGIADRASVASGARSALFGSCSGGHDGRLRVLGFLGDDVDYAVYRVGTPQGR